MPLTSAARRPLVPNPASGMYFLTANSGVSNASNTLGNGTLRLLPMIIESALRVDRIGGEVLATVGEAGSVVRLGIYADNGACYPSALMLDAGPMDGTSATVQEFVCDVFFSPGLYWIGGVVQAAPTTQPNVRIATGWHPPLPTAVTGVASVPQGANTLLAGFGQVGVTGALPATLSTTHSGIGNAPRVFLRVA